LPLPEYIVNDLGWYESTEVVITIDGNELVITDVETYENF
jgi:antitoxin component of MazEF toxin-antitoxin module